MRFLIIINDNAIEIKYIMSRGLPNDSIKFVKV